MHWIKSTPRLKLLVAVVSYILLLHVAYIYMMAPYFSYAGLYYSPGSKAIVALSWLVAAMPVAWLPLATNRPSLVAYYVLYAFVIIPVCIVPVYTGKPGETVAKIWISMLICFAVLGVTYVVPLGRLPQIRISQSWFFTLLALFSAVAYLMVTHYVGFSFRFPNPMHVYDAREEYKALTATVDSKWFAYFSQWQAFVVNPLLVGYGLISKKYPILAIGIVGQLALYALGGLKQVLFSSFLVCALYLLRKRKLFGPSFFWSLSGFFSFCMALDILTQQFSLGLTGLFLRRLTFLPAQITGMYLDFFSSNPFALLGHSVLKGVVTYPYSLEPPSLIGATYFGNDRTVADGNFLADGFANFGYFGMFGATLLLGFLLWLVDSSSAKRNELMSRLLLGMPSVVLANCGLLTSIGNHGLGFAILVIYLLPRELDPGEASAPQEEKIGARKLASGALADVAGRSPSTLQFR